MPRLGLPLAGQVPLYLGNMQEDLHVVGRGGLAELITGGLTSTSKMPCPTWGIPAILATGHGQGIILWDLKTGKQLRTLPGHTQVHIALAFSADGSKLASGNYDGTVRLWDLASGKELQNFRVEKAIGVLPEWELE